MTASDSALTRRERWVSGLAGSSLIASGVVAIFMEKGDVGPASLVGIGSVFLILALNGRKISRARIGENEVEFARELRRQLATALADRDQTSEELAEVVLDFADPEVDPLASLASAVLYERRVLAALEALGVEVITGEGVVDKGVDAMVHTEAGPRLGVVIKATIRPLTAGVVNHSFRGFLETDARAGILVSRSGFSESARRAAPGLRIALATWDVHDGLEALADAVRTADDYARSNP
ncbi:MAG TPA: restriction endonuclease [Actinomycetota bacterium]|nr:restriction endonuclease [Actinomycetota bacterium]